MTLGRRDGACPPRLCLPGLSGARIPPHPPAGGRARLTKASGWAGAPKLLQQGLYPALPSAGCPEVGYGTRPVAPFTRATAPGHPGADTPASRHSGLCLSPPVCPAPTQGAGRLGVWLTAPPVRPTLGRRVPPGWGSRTPPPTGTAARLGVSWWPNRISARNEVWGLYRRPRLAASDTYFNLLPRYQYLGI